MKTPNAFSDGTMRPVIRIMMARDSIFWGPGVRDLLKLIAATGSVRLACTQMAMSYSKGWKLLKTLETHMGFEAVRRQQGGKGGGEARLTEEGEDMLRHFEAFEQECKIVVEEIFESHFGKAGGEKSER